MIVVADTSPINYLILLGRIEVLHQIYGEVLIPHAVLDELLDGAAPAAVQDWASRPPLWLRVSDIPSDPDPELKWLDRGEREAIQLADFVKANRLIIDDMDGRRAAQNRNLSVIGTLGILAEASRRGLLDLAQTLAALQATNFHIAPSLIRRLLDHEEERRRRT